MPEPNVVSGIRGTPDGDSDDEFAEGSADLLQSARQNSEASGRCRSIMDCLSNSALQSTGPKQHLSSPKTTMLAMQRAKHCAFPDTSQSALHLMLCYYGCRLETAGKWLRERPVNLWPSHWSGNLATDVVCSSVIGLQL